MNPRRFDTETLSFEYFDTQDRLSIKIKNEDVYGSAENAPYRIQQGALYAVGVEIQECFTGAQRLPVNSHIHQVGRILTPWFQAYTDDRVDLERGLRRFYALNAYELLDKSPSAFAVAIENTKTLYETSLSRIPELEAKHADLKQSLAFNYQDKGVHTLRGTTIFDTRAQTWILYETSTLDPDKPEYLWGIRRFNDHMEMLPLIEKAPQTNQKALALIMEEQKALYGSNTLDLDKLESGAAKVQAVLSQLEAILDIPPEDSKLHLLEPLLQP